MKVEVYKKVEENIERLYINTHVRYWEDGYINGIPDDPDYPKMPATEWDNEFSEYRWKPIINIDKGLIENWSPGIKASIHYKVCDEFYCSIPEIDFELDGYVPKFMCPRDEGFGDYIIMNISESGEIEEWNKEMLGKYIKESLL